MDDLLLRKRMMSQSADGGWKTYTLSRSFSGGSIETVDTGIALYQKNEWSLTAVFTVTSRPTASFYPIRLSGWSVLPTVELGPSLIRLGSVDQNENPTGTTFTLTASWKAGVGGSATISGGSVNLSNTIAANMQYANTLSLFYPTRYALPGTIDITIKYKE